MDDKQTDVLIVGAGPAGMVSALCLARLGLRSIVVERQPGLDEHPKGHEINTRTIEILNELGISTGELAEEASPDSDGSRILFCRTINEEFGRIDLLADGSSAQKYASHLRSKKPYLNLSQTEFERVIRRHLSAEPHIELLLEHEWQSFVDDGAATESEVRSLANGEAFRVRSRYLIGADGAGSRVRKSLGIQMIGPEKIEDFVNVYFEENLRDFVETPAKLYWIFHPEGYGAFIAHHVDKRWTYNFPIVSPYERREDFTEEVLKKRIKKALGADRDIQIKSVSHWRMTCQVADRYRSGRVFLVGDSAHRFPPTGGLGLNTGIPDAHNLCWKLAGVMRGQAPESLLDTYELERKPVAERNGAESLKNYNKMFEVIEAFGLKRDGPETLAKIKDDAVVKALPSFLQNALLWLLQLPAHFLLKRFWLSNRVRSRVSHSIVDQIGHFDRIGLDIGYIYERGAVATEPGGSTSHGQQVTDYTPSTRPGARFPHVQLDGKPEGRSSHDLMSYDRYTLLLGGDGANWREAAQSLYASLKTEVRAVSVHEASTDADARACLESTCEIGSDGALLLRPDGHVAWRRKDGAEDPATALRDAAAKVGLA